MAISTDYQPNRIPYMFFINMLMKSGRTKSKTIRAIRIIRVNP